MKAVGVRASSVIKQLQTSRMFVRSSSARRYKHSPVIIFMLCWGRNLLSLSNVALHPLFCVININTTRFMWVLIWEIYKHSQRLSLHNVSISPDINHKRDFGKNLRFTATLDRENPNKKKSSHREISWNYVENIEVRFVQMLRSIWSPHPRHQNLPTVNWGLNLQAI